jgi:Stage II sporulation protein E (SpoIIE)
VPNHREGPIAPRVRRFAQSVVIVLVPFALTVKVAAATAGASVYLRIYLAHHPPPDFLDGYLVLAVLLGAMSMACLIVWLNAQKVSVFRTMSGYLFAIAVVDFVDFHSLSWEWIPVTTACLFSFELFAEALRVPKHIWIWLPRLLWVGALIVGLFHGGTWDRKAAIELWAMHLTLYPTLILILIGVLRGGRRERLIAIPLLITDLAYLPTLQEVQRHLHVPFGIVIFGWLWQWGEATQILLCAIVFAIFVRELVADQRARIRLEGEVEAARSVQQVLVPAESPSILGFAIEAVYRPAGEVGGDFYQIVPIPTGGALAVIGDVSGKGMPAAMTVSLLVGTFRTLAHYTQVPGEILRAMNQRMIGRANGGFTTCLVLRIDPDGVLTAANAGHLAPYIDGNEIDLQGGLPLGLAVETEYPEARLVLPSGARITLITDGVVEAQTPIGELFGFDRTRSISTQSAEAIARAAQAHGQEDDITVLTLQFAPAEVAHA